MSVIEISGLDKYYISYSKSGFLRKKSKQHVLKNIALKIELGEVIGLVGESGSGKSTLANIIMGLTNYTNGRVLLFGDEVSQMDKIKRKQVQKKCQLILQNPYTTFNLLQPIDKALQEPMLVNGISKSSKEATIQIRAMMDAFRLNKSYLTKLPTELSGGELQRVSIIRAMLLSPQCLICDEIISALDVALQLDILKMMKTQAKDKKQTCLFITHNIATIKNFADKIIVMKEGKIVEQGPVERIIHHARSPYTKALIQGIPKWPY